MKDQMRLSDRARLATVKGAPSSNLEEDAVSGVVRGNPKCMKWPGITKTFGGGLTGFARSVSPM